MDKARSRVLARLRMMPFTLCPACRLVQDHLLSALPCSECLDSLLVAPRICATCFGFACEPERCSRDWIRIEGAGNSPTRFSGVHAAYLSIGPGFRVLKAWKVSQNPPLERYLLAGVRRALARFDTAESITLIPVPQSASRRWELQGGSTLRLCEMIRVCRREKGLRTELCEILEIAESDPTSSQAKQRGSERYRRTSTFRVRAESPEISRGTPALLVDDFLTSGTTLRNAMRALAGMKSPEDFPAHAFLLGFRPSFEPTRNQI